MKKKILLLCLICIPVLITAVIGLINTKKSDSTTDTENVSENRPDWASLVVTDSLPLEYATEFGVDFYGDDYTMINICDGSYFLVCEEGAPVPCNVPSGITVLAQPVESIYLAATSAMNLFDALDSLDKIALSGTDTDGWYIENAKAAMESGKIIYAGKYNKPDYELILSKGCGLVIESTMISHAPEVKEKFLELGIPVLVDWSSYESHPLGRSEWIKLYGVLTGSLDLAVSEFEKQSAYLKDFSENNENKKTVAYFYISSQGSVVTRKSGDYIAKMIELAGGKYLFGSEKEDDTATSSMTLEMEKFYEQARTADVIIYNNTTTDEVTNISELVAKNPLLNDFKAVRDGNVWCTGKNLYQETLQFGRVIKDINLILNDGDENQLHYFNRLR